MVVGVKKFTMKYVVPKIAKNLKGRQEAKEDIFKTVDEATGPYVSSQDKSKIKTEAGKKVSKIFNKKEKSEKNLKELKNLSKGAIATSGAGVTAAGVSLYNKKKNKNVGSTNPRRPGKKFGGGITTKKSNVKKIQEAFGPGSKNPKKSAAKKKKFPDLTGDGKVTFADILKGRGVKRG